MPMSMLMGRCRSEISKCLRNIHACIRNLKWMLNIDAQHDCLSKGRGSLLEMSYKKDVLKNFRKFRSSHRRCSVRVFFEYSCRQKPSTLFFIKKETRAKVFSCNFFSKFLKIRILQNSSRRLLLKNHRTTFVLESLFSITSRLKACNITKKECPAQVFSSEFYKILKNIYFV